jgi:hypothetical protein
VDIPTLGNAPSAILVTIAKTAPNKAKVYAVSTAERVVIGEAEVTLMCQPQVTQEVFGSIVQALAQAFGVGNRLIAAPEGILGHLPPVQDAR